MWSDTEKRNQLLVAALMFLIIIVIIVDVRSDVMAGSPLSHVAGELVVMTLSVVLLVMISFQTFRSMKQSLRHSERSLLAAKEEAEMWKSQVQAIKPSLSEALDKQFRAWSLTPSEEEIARLILKGLSNKEIAEVRNSTEQTVKQQANSIYKKSSLTSRTQLAAYFLEDLF